MTYHFFSTSAGLGVYVRTWLSLFSVVTRAKRRVAVRECLGAGEWEYTKRMTMHKNTRVIPTRSKALNRL